MSCIKSVVEKEQPAHLAGTVILRIHRRKDRNAVNEAVMQRLEELLDEIEGDSSVRVVLLTAEGHEAFSAGGDLKYFATLRTREAGL